MKRIILSLLILWQSAAPRREFELNIDSVNDFMIKQNENGYNGFLVMTLSEEGVVKINKTPESHSVFSDFVKKYSGERNSVDRIDWKTALTRTSPLICKLDKDNITVYLPREILGRPKNLEPKVSRLIDKILTGVLVLGPEEKQAILKDISGKNIFQMPQGDRLKLIQLCKHYIPDLAWAVTAILSHLEHFEKQSKGTKIPVISLSSDNLASRTITKKNLIFVDEKHFDKDEPGVYQVSHIRERTKSFELDTTDLIISMLINLFVFIDKTPKGDLLIAEGALNGQILLHARKAIPRLNGRVLVKLKLEEQPKIEPEPAPTPVPLVEEPKVVAPEIPDGAWTVGVPRVEADNRSIKTSENGKFEVLDGGIINYFGPDGRRDDDKSSAICQLIGRKDFSIQLPVGDLVKLIRSFNNTFKKDLPINLHNHLQAGSKTPCTFMRNVDGLHVRFERGEKKVITLNSSAREQASGGDGRR